MTKDKIIDKIGELLCDKTCGRLTKDNELEKENGEFGSLTTLTYLQRKIFPLLDQLKEENI